MVTAGQTTSFTLPGHALRPTVPGLFMVYKNGHYFTHVPSCRSQVAGLLIVV